MTIKKIGKITNGQDGAIYAGLLFRFDARANCCVYRLAELNEASTPIACFTPDKVDRIRPHCNAVTFGTARYSAEDTYPLLYCNVYNTYAKEADKKLGTTCVYRLQEAGNSFTATLVQVIEVGFTADPLWASAGGDVRPYGNMTIDTAREVYYAFAMRDQEPTMRFFAFPLPAPDAGQWDEELGARRVTLQKEDIVEQFNTPYQRFVQGACVHDGVIYSMASLAGYTAPIEPCLHRIDAAKGLQIDSYFFGSHGVLTEPEFIDFDGDTCYYGDPENVYILTF